jgi:RNA polymerase sigma-70 factor (ECF subfamily)
MTPERLHARYAERIDRQARRTIGSDADREDLVHEVLMAVFRGFHTIREPKAADAWVRRVTAVMIIDLVRRRRLRPQVSLDSLPETAVPSFQAGEAGELASRAVRILQRLPARERSLLMAYWFTPATLQSLASELGCSVVTVKRHMLRARGRFERLALRDPDLARYMSDSRRRYGRGF